MKRNYYILGTLLCGMSLTTHADSLRISATEFAKDPAKVSALQKGLEKCEQIIMLPFITGVSYKL